MIEERLWLLISLKLSAEAEPHELEELDNLMQEHPDLELRSRMLETIWMSRHIGNELADKEQSFNKHMQRLSVHLSEPVLQYEEPVDTEKTVDVPEKKRPVLRRLVMAAGVAASLFLILYLVSPGMFTNKSFKSQASQNTVSTKKGSKSKIQLPDGTQVWLNADSKITYNENFQGSLREVELTGEAFFDVVRDESRPFVIHTSVIDVKVLGTAFNVRSYSDEKNTETSLIRGSVEVTLRDNPDKKYMLKPNDKLTIDNKQAKAVCEDVTADKTAGYSKQAVLLTLGKVRYKEKDSSIVETLWVKNRLAFDAEPLEQVALKLERWFDVKVTITDEALKRNEYTAFFEEESLQEVMDALEYTGKFRYTINKKEIVIRP
jgi:ferric-dicitrate binding protein FerR (iron transport regulator)